MTDRAKPSRLDVVISVAASAVVALMLVVTIVLSFSEPTGPPEFRVDLADARSVESGQLVEIRVENTGGHAAESFTVVATLPDGTELDQDGGWLSPGESDRLTYLVADDVPVDAITFEVVSFDAAG